MGFYVVEYFGIFNSVKIITKNYKFEWIVVI
jgi:hypothetical protein